MNQAMLNTELYQTMYAEQERYKAELLCMPRKYSVCPQDLPRYSHVPSHHIPAMVTEYASVQLLGFDMFGNLTHIFSLHDFCSSGQ